MIQEHKYKLIAVAIVFYLVQLIASIPATQVLNRLSLPNNIQIQGVGGSVWSGTAQSITMDGIQVNNVNWELRFLSLMMGKAAAKIKAGNASDAESIFFDGDIKITLTGSRLVMDDAKIRLPTHMVMAQLSLPLPVNAEGRFNMDIEHLDYLLVARECQNIAAKGSWVNASVQGMNGFIQLGEFNANAVCENTNVKVTVQPQNLLNLAAEAILNNKGQINVTGKFKPDASLPTEVHRAAIMFGKADNEGFYKVSM